MENQIKNLKTHEEKLEKQLEQLKLAQVEHKKTLEEV